MAAAVVLAIVGVAVRDRDRDGCNVFFLGPADAEEDLVTRRREGGDRFCFVLPSLVALSVLLLSFL